MAFQSVSRMMESVSSCSRCRAAVYRARAASVTMPGHTKYPSASNCVRLKVLSGG